MRIDAYNQIQKLYGTGKAKKADDMKQAATSFHDQLLLSAAGRDVQIAKQAIANAPDIRESLVAPLKERIDNGTYEVDTEDFAAKLLDEYNGLF